MRTLLRLQQAGRLGKAHADFAAAVHLCCSRFVPTVSTELRRRAAAGELVVKLTASTLPLCRRK